MKIALLSLLLCAVPLLAARYPGDYDAPSAGLFSSDLFSLRQTTHSSQPGEPRFFGEDDRVTSRDAKGRPLLAECHILSEDTVADSATYRFEWDGDIPGTGDYPGWTPSRLMLSRYLRGNFVDSTVEFRSWNAQARVVTQLLSWLRDSTFFDVQGRVVRQVSWHYFGSDSSWSDSTRLTGREYRAEFRGASDSLPEREIGFYLSNGLWALNDTLRYFGPANRPDSSRQGGAARWYRYDGAGRRILEGSGADTMMRYGYDAKGRLVTEVNRTDTIWYSYDAFLSGVSKGKPAASEIGVTRTVDGIRLELGAASLRSLEFRDLRGRLLASFPGLAGAQGCMQLKTTPLSGAVLVRVRTDRGETVKSLPLR